MRKQMAVALSIGAAVLCGIVAAAAPRAVQRGQGPPVTLPEGNGQALVQAQCSRCHGLNRITGSWGYTREGWEQLFGTMVSLPDDQRRTIATYLAANFPEQPHPPAVLIPGPASVSYTPAADRPSCESS